jgi:hypothetical protein
MVGFGTGFQNIRTHGANAPRKLHIDVGPLPAALREIACVAIWDIRVARGNAGWPAGCAEGAPKAGVDDILEVPVRVGFEIGTTVVHTTR